MAVMSAQRESVLRTIEERDIRFVRLWFTDVQGFLKSFSITPAELDEAFEDGLVFDGSVIQGFARAQEADMLAVPDPATFELLPWVGDGSRTSQKRRASRSPAIPARSCGATSIGPVATASR